jgi:hypothetical protein
VIKRSEAGICGSSTQSGSRTLAATFFLKSAAPFQPSLLLAFLKASTETVSPIEGDQIGPVLFVDQNKDAGGERHNVEQENGWPDVQAEPQRAIDDQVNREQKHSDVFVQFHDVDLLDHLPG